jgi:hypothetical protein
MYIVRAASLEAGRAEVSVMSERAANVPSAGISLRQSLVSLNLIKLSSEEDMMQVLRSFIVATALFGLAISVNQAPAQTKSLKDSIAGSWTITAVFDEYQSGEKKDNWGGPVKGDITFSNGRFSQILVGPAVASMKSDDPRRPDALTVAYYGSYSVDEAGKKIVAKIEGASYSPRGGTDTGWTVSGSGDTLTLLGTPRKDQHGTFTPKLEVKRAK